MHDDAEFADLPEAVPLYKVAPFWRFLAILASIGMVGLLFVTIVFGIALLQMGNSGVAVMPPAPPAVMMAPPVISSATDEEVESDSANAPFPVKADLARSGPRDPANENPFAPGEARLSPRQRFLSKGVATWTHRGSPIDTVTISPDGKNMAYVAEGNLIAGLIGSPQKVQASEPEVPAFVPQPGVALRGGRRMQFIYPGMPGGPTVAEEIKLVGIPSWSGDSQFVDCSDAGGRVHRFNIQALVNLGDAVQFGPEGVGNVPFRGAWPVSLPADSSKIVFVRSRPQVKIEVPGSPAAADPTEVVLGDMKPQSTRVLVPSSSDTWRHLSVSPDGKRLALVSDRGLEGKQAGQVRLFVMDMEGGEPRPLTSPASKLGSLSWTPDSKALIYARSQDPRVPSDIWDEEELIPPEATDLFLWDLTTNRETRLSRGGGFFSPSVSRDGVLFYLAMIRAGSESNLVLRRTSLQAALEFAAGEREIVQRDSSGWTALLDRVLKESQVALPAEGADLTAERLAKLADVFQRVYREQFKAEPPSTHKGLERQRWEVQSLNLPPELRPKLAVVLGAVEGEYLVRRHGARWHVTKGPLTEPPQGVPVGGVESLFAHVTNPFEAVSWWERGVPGRDADEYLGHGRQLVLANSRKAGQASTAALADPDLERGMALLRQNKGTEADQVLLAMMKQKRHEHNLHLALHVGKLLYEHKRSAALRQLLEQQMELSPADARLYNLLGLAHLETEPRQAIDAFKNALRCDLYFGPGYFNLAQAYQKIEDRDAARRCLQRYLRLLPRGDLDLAADAERRLRELNDPSGN